MSVELKPCPCKDCDTRKTYALLVDMYDTDAYYEMENGPVRYWMPIEPPKEDA